MWVYVLEIAIIRGAMAPLAPLEMARLIALKFISYLNSSETALFYRWRNIQPFGKQI